MKSKLAITSFILSLIPIIFILFFFVIRVLAYGQVYDNLLWIIDALVFFSFFWIVIYILSFVFGIFALLNKKDNLGGKGFAITGIAISATMLLIIITFFISLAVRGISLA